MKIYLVEDIMYAPGRILACFANYEDAENFANSLRQDTTIDERTLWQGQPPNPGYND